MMKVISRLVLISLLLIAGLSNVNAQNLQLSVRGGYHNSFISTRDFDLVGAKSTLSPGYGVSLQYFYVPRTYYADYRLGVIGGVEISNHSQRREDVMMFNDTSEYTLKSSTTLKYLDIPLMFRIDHDDFGPYFEIGGQLSYLRDASFSHSNSMDPSRDFALPDAKSQFTPMLYSAVMGVGADWFPAEWIGLSLGVRARYGINDVNEPQKNNPDFSPQNLSGLFFNMAINFKLNHHHSTRW